MAAAQLGVARIGLERIGEAVDVARRRPACRSRRRGPDWSRPVASAAITGRPQAIASRVTLPNASVIDGLRKTSALASARASSSPVMLADEDRVGQLLLEPRPRRAFADDQHAMLDAARRRSASMASANTSSPFSITSRPRKATTISSSAMPSARRHSMSRRSGLNCSRSMPRAQIAMSRFIRCARRIAAVDSAGAMTTSQR